MFIKVNESNVIYSSEEQKSAETDIEIEESISFLDAKGRAQWKYIDGAVVARTEEEMESDWIYPPLVSIASPEQRMNDLEAAIALMSFGGSIT